MLQDIQAVVNRLTTSGDLTVSEVIRLTNVALRLDAAIRGREREKAPASSPARPDARFEYGEIWDAIHQVAKGAIILDTYPSMREVARICPDGAFSAAFVHGRVTTLWCRPEALAHALLAKQGKRVVTGTLATESRAVMHDLLIVWGPRLSDAGVDVLRQLRGTRTYAEITITTPETAPQEGGK